MSNTDITTKKHLGVNPGAREGFLQDTRRVTNIYSQVR